MPRSDTYIEKEASINEQIDRMRHSATRSLLERDDVIIVASVSCIYGLGSVEAYSKMTLAIKKNYDYDREQIIRSLVALQYKRNDQNFYRGTFRARGEYLEIFPSHLEDRAWRLSLFGNKLENIEEFDPLTGDTIKSLNVIKLPDLFDIFITFPLLISLTSWQTFTSKLDFELVTALTADVTLEIYPEWSAPQILIILQKPLLNLSLW